MSPMLYQAATLVLPMIFAIVFHEVAHGLAARALGDRTAQEQGRLSLNPLRHVDPFGTIILPGLLKLAGMPVFGWAKPVPVNYGRLRRPQRDMALVAAAGPLSNFVLAGLASVGIGLIVRAWPGPQAPDPSVVFVIDNLGNFVLVNVFLGMFNLLPLPPFDGSRILRGVMPRPGVRLLDRIEPYGIVVFMLVFVVLPWISPGLHLVDALVMPPVDWAVGHYETLVGWVAGSTTA